LPVVIQVTKMGFVFILHRLTGDPVFPVEERSVPQSEVPGERTWKTQPFPLKPPPLSRHEPLRRDELANLTPAHKAYCEDLFDSSVSGGVYMPAGLELTLSFPGTLGGATWSGASFDSSSGYLFVNVNEVGRIARMEKESGTYRRNSPWGAYARFWDQNQWPCQEPPWGTLNAVNLATGERVWTVPLGGVRALEKNGIAETGAPNLGGSMVTRGGLVFIAGTNDRRFRAFAAHNGEEVWVTDLEASGHATPMTYLGANGKQYVVIAAGGGGTFSPDRTADTLVAFALPTSSP
jgi:quinoprotein glucose dehydrogenase